jgi:hypothetical protein
VILVDTPRWIWRGQVWGHLVSDSSIEELHDFARELGKRRIGFQGDHYDLSSEEHERALEAGAVNVDSRELVRRLRKAGLRHRSKKPNWNIVYQSDRSHYLPEIVQVLAISIPEKTRRERFTEALQSVSPLVKIVGVLLVERVDLMALVLEFPDAPYVDSERLDLLNYTYAQERHVVEMIISQE